MKLHLISFAGPGLVWRATSKRFLREARHTGLFERVKVYTERDFFQSGTSLSTTERDLISEFPKGYGLWIWKPIIIQSHLEILETEELLLYCDVGSSFGAPYEISNSFSVSANQIASEGPTFLTYLETQIIFGPGPQWLVYLKTMSSRNYPKLTRLMRE